MHLPAWLSPTVFLIALTGCTDDAARTTLPPDPPVAPVPVGVYRIAVTGLGTGEMRSAIIPVDGGDPSPPLSLAPVGSGLGFEHVSSSSFTEGPRGAGGQRYVSFTYRVRNRTGAALNNLTLLMVSRAGSLPGTPISSLRKFDGSAADSAIASAVVPTGAVAMQSDLSSMAALYPDVLQVLTEAEVAAITAPAGVTEVFPYGYVVRSAGTESTSRTIPAATSADQFDGLLTLSFRLPLQSSTVEDAYSFYFEVMAVEDSETRLTESIEEAQDSAAVRRLRERAASLGATTVTVLAGSPAAGAQVEDYPGQRQLCSVRTAGAAAAPVSFITRPAAYVRISLFRPGEHPSACDAEFRTGTAAAPVVDEPYPVTARAADRYGNVITGAVDTVSLSQGSGPPVTVGAATALSSGAAEIPVTFHGNGLSVLNAGGRRARGRRVLQVPGPVVGVEIRAATVAAGSTHSCGLTPDGQAYCWGRNSSGQLGDGTTTDRPTPVPVATGLRFASIRAGIYHTVALTPSGQAYAWGGNAEGQLGDGTTTARVAPVPVAGGLVFTSIDAGAQHSVALTPSGEAYAWGWNYWFQLGDSTVTDRVVPVPVKGGIIFTSLAAGGTHTVGISSTGRAYEWGRNNYGSLGVLIERVPRPVDGGLTFASVSTGIFHKVALTPAGEAYAWGRNTHGELGDGTTSTRRVPVAVRGGLRFARISAGSYFTIALTDSGVAYAWGQNASGSLGDSTTANRSMPVMVAGGHSFVAISEGVYRGHTVALTSTGAAYVWGENAAGQLGDGTTQNRAAPVPQPGGPRFAVP